MSYQITAHEPVEERRDDPHSTVKTHRTFATHPTRPDAIDTARALLKTHAEVTIWDGEPGASRIIGNWLPPNIIILSQPRWVGKAPSVTSWFSRSVVDRHFYEYTASDGRKVNYAFETNVDEAPQVPEFGTKEAIEQYHRQWEYRNNQGRKHAEAMAVATGP